jgi:hypothetical protein
LSRGVWSSELFRGDTEFSSVAGVSAYGKSGGDAYRNSGGDAYTGPPVIDPVVDIGDMYVPRSGS